MGSTNDNNSSKYNTNDMKKSTGNINKIKSIYITKKILSYLEIDKKLNMIRYNKNLQKRLRKDINDYFKEYTEIIIEITLLKKNMENL